MKQRSLVLMATAALVGALAAASPASADCNGPYPSFRETAPMARTVFVGRVAEVVFQANWDWSSQFTVEVEHVLRGDVAPVLLIKDLPSGGCAGYIPAKAGMRIALALDGVAVEPWTTANAIAVIDGPTPDLVGIEAMSLEDVLAIVPAPLAPPDPAVDPIPAVLAFVVVVLVVGGLVAWRTRQE